MVEKKMTPSQIKQARKLAMEKQKGAINEPNLIKAQVTYLLFDG